MTVRIEINTKPVPVPILKEYCESLAYGQFVGKVRSHFDPLFKLPRVTIDGRLYLIDNEENWLLVHAKNMQIAVQNAFKQVESGKAIIVDRDLITVHHGGQPKPCYPFKA